jgi:hypothetical protein
MIEVGQFRVSKSSGVLPFWMRLAVVTELCGKRSLY